MNEPINLQELREQAERAIGFPASWEDEAPSPREVLALIEAVEAAQQLESTTLDWSGSERDSLTRFREALRRFGP